MNRLLLLVVAAVIGLASLPGEAAGRQDQGDRTLSPYFFVKSDSPEVDRLPLASSSVSVDIAGVIASVRLTQVYKNTGTRAIEAIYVFPGSTRAAVHGMTMTIGERRIVAKIEERQEARRQYEAARNAGQTASLLEQQRPNVFQMNVANILPGDQIKVELFYTELLVPRDHVYQFVFPTVVGPRYTNRRADGASGSDTWVQNPYLREGEPPTARFEFRASISSGMPVKEIASPSHELQVDYTDQQRARVSLRSTGQPAGNRDIVLRYRLAGDRIETGLLLGSSGDERFFLCMVEPPRRVAPGAVPPREYVFVMDVSGSMNGFPIETSKELLRNLLAGLRPTDSFNVLFFAGGSYLLAPASLPATEANKATAIREVGRQGGSGGTELLPALTTALGLPRIRPGVSRVVVIATDGYVDVERESFALIRDHLGDMSVFTFGIGSSVNRHLIEGMARVGEGEPFVVLNAAEAREVAARFLDYIVSPLLTRVSVRTPGFQAYDLEPARTPDLFASRPILIVGKYRGDAAGEIVVTGYTGEGRFERRIPVMGRPTPAGDSLGYLWARERVAVLSDFRAARGGVDEENRRQITELGLRYNLLTEFTSFVAIDQRLRRRDGGYETVKQPLPLPRGVSDLAVGGSVAESVAMTTALAPTLAGVANKTAAMPRAAAPQAPPPPLQDAREQKATRRVAVVENGLQNRASIAVSVLEAWLTDALSKGDAATALALTRGQRRFKIWFDAAGRATRMDLFDAAGPGDAPGRVATILRALQKAGVSVAKGGYVVVAIE